MYRSVRGFETGAPSTPLIKAMAGFSGNRFVLISTPDLGVPPYIKDYLAASGCSYQEMDNLAEAMPLLDVLYMTRIQQERFAPLRRNTSGRRASMCWTRKR